MSSRRRCVGVLVGPAAVWVAVAGGACDGRPLSPADDAQVSYLRDVASRRASLVASLVDPGNGYSSLRLAHYASGTAGDWERLDAWNPRVAVVGVDALDAPPSTPPGQARALAPPDETTWEPSTSLVALGEDAFFHYPAQLAPASLAPPWRAAAARYGLWLDETRGVAGSSRSRCRTARRSP
jgi:hypothetical protein